MDSITEMRGATELSLSHKVIAVIMSLILALGLSPIGQTPAKAYADGDTPSDKATLHVEIDGNGSVKVNESPALKAKGDKQVDKNKTADIVATPDEGYEFTSWTVSNTSAELTGDPAAATNGIAMKNGSATLTAKFTAVEYNVTVAAEIENGTVAVNPAKAKKGDTVTVTATPNDGYQVKEIKAGDTVLSGNTFTMPANNVEVTATFELLPTYDVTISTVTGGVVSADAKEAHAGQVVTLNNTPNDGWMLVEYSVKDTDNQDVTVTDGKFTMPAKAVTVSATFRQRVAYKITVENGSPSLTGGTVSVNVENPSATLEGTTVTVNTTPYSSAWVLDTITVKDAADNVIALTGNTFTMPAGNVTVSATFRTAQKFKITVNNSPTLDHGTVTTDATNPSATLEGTVVTVTATPDTYYELESISVKAGSEDVALTDNAFVMPNSDVVVSAKFKKLTEVPVPQGQTYTYDGKVKSYVVAEDAPYVLSGVTSETKAGTYKATATLKEGYVWSGGSVEPKDITWTIAKATIAAPKATDRIYNGSVQTGVAGGTGYTVKNGTGTDANSYTATVTADANHQFAGGKTSVTVAWKISPANIATATVTLSKASAAYTGKNQTSGVQSVKLGNKTLTIADYTAAAASGKTVGTYNATVTGKGNYTGTATAAFKITQAKNTAKAKKTSVKKTYKVKNLKKKAAKIALPKVTTKFGTAKWKVSTKDKKKVLSLKSGKIQVKKGAKKGTYTIKLKASVAKTKNYTAATTKVVTVKVTVKK